MSELIRLDVEHARHLAVHVLSALGTPREHAQEVAAHLVEADCVGHGSHGISRLPSYIDYVDNGILDPAARPTTLTEGRCAVVSANWGFSHVAARITTELACEQALSERIGMAGLVQSTHLGRLGAYMEQACRADCVALAFVGGMGGQRLVAPFGGRAGLLGSNPIAAGFPTASGVPLVVDFSTAAAPIGKIMVAAMAGERMPSQSLVDQHGQPTDDPNTLAAGGAMRTFGEHKGFGLAVVVELLGRVLLGPGAFGHDQKSEIFRAQGLLLVAIAADAFRDLADVLGDAEQLRDLIHAVPPAAGFDQVLAPGDPETANRHRHAEGFSVKLGAWQAISDAARKVGVGQQALDAAVIP
ncbi:Ldh family oxidoreductase [Mycolicibacterium hodleri]|uniref:Ldh family oxidoreductase n=1 Tax=Mycolicibacterium hodleri TaxID=49897 RepID=UPI00163C3225|nr:Ldh family oxidoreductase [Mycolicibacterium hodleri]